MGYQITGRITTERWTYEIGKNDKSQSTTKCSTYGVASNAGCTPQSGYSWASNQLVTLEGLRTRCSSQVAASAEVTGENGCEKILYTFGTCDGSWRLMDDIRLVNASGGYNYVSIRNSVIKRSVSC